MRIEGCAKNGSVVGNLFSKHEINSTRNKNFYS